MSDGELVPRGLKSLALTIWGEARGESFKGRVAVASVVMNRVRRGGWWGNTVEEVCHKPGQFSMWNPGDPNLEAIKNLDSNDPLYLECLGIAALVMSGRKDLPADFQFPDDVYHYMTKKLYDTAPPKWAKDRLFDFAVQNHVYFRDIK